MVPIVAPSMLGKGSMRGRSLGPAAGFLAGVLGARSETSMPTAPSRSRLRCAFTAGTVRERLPAIELAISWQALRVDARRRTRRSEDRRQAERPDRTTALMIIPLAL